MQIMEYRANMIDAYLTVRNLDNGGTVVSCRVPKSEETGSV
jgi:nitrate/nitrite-specific signal transduction histidine kinase